jgi:hypothetical protein
LGNIYGKYTTVEEIVRYLTVGVLLERTFFMVLDSYLNEQKGKVHGNMNRSDSYNGSLAFIMPISRACLQNTMGPNGFSAGLQI